MSEHTLHGSSEASEKDSLSSTSSYIPVGPDRMVELESGRRTSENEQEESRLREEQTKEPNCNSDTVREEGHRERNIEKVYEEHLKEEHEVKMKNSKKRRNSCLVLSCSCLDENLTFTSSLEPLQILP